MANIIKDKLKENEVTIGDGSSTDKKLKFDDGSVTPAYINKNTSGELTYSSAGTTEDEVILTKQTKIHTQNTPSATWVITHTLRGYPSVTIVDSAGSVVIGEIVYDSTSQVTLTFSGAFSGKAYLN